MSLVEYKKKRSFNRTPEPTGGKGSGKKLHFVIQKHAASRLHYDFRLEMEGVPRHTSPQGPAQGSGSRAFLIDHKLLTW